MSFDERRYIEAIPPQLFDEMISDYAASLPADSHHKPTARTVKQIALQLADRQRYSPLHRQDCVNTTLQQLADYCCVKPSSISDALRCLEFLGIVKTIRKGGGPLKKQRFEMSICRSLHNGEFPHLNQTKERSKSLNTMGNLTNSTGN
jgi:DNA-binding transcriptional regulator YhcF (GntR family)